MSPPSRWVLRMGSAGITRADLSDHALDRDVRPIATARGADAVRQAAPSDGTRWPGGADYCLARSLERYLASLGPLAHRVEQGTFNPKVPGSSPGRPTRDPHSERSPQRVPASGHQRSSTSL